MVPICQSKSLFPSLIYKTNKLGRQASRIVMFQLKGFLLFNSKRECIAQIKCEHSLDASTIMKLEVKKTTLLRSLMARKKLIRLDLCVKVLIQLKPKFMFLT